MMSLLAEIGLTAVDHDERSQWDLRKAGTKPPYDALSYIPC
jgi:hypothetical protein